MQLFGADRPLQIEGAITFAPEELAGIPINYLYNNALQQSYSIEDTFGIPEYFNDPFIEN